MKYKIVTTSGNVFLRSGPGKEYDPIGRLYRDGVYDIDDLQSVPGWAYVTDGNLYDGGRGPGYASMDYMVPYEEPPAPEPVVSFARDELEQVYTWLGGLLGK